jgi:regulatory protein
LNRPADSEGQEAWQQAYATALRLLARREHSTHELRTKLRTRRCPAELVEQVLNTLRDEGALSDRRFVDSYVQVRFDRGFGPLRIEAELRERGIGGSLAGEVLEEFAPLWTASASRQRHKRFGDGVPSAFEERARQMRFLQQRGFTGEQVRTAIEAGPEIA